MGDASGSIPGRQPGVVVRHTASGQEWRELMLGNSLGMPGG